MVVNRYRKRQVLFMVSDYEHEIIMSYYKKSDQKSLANYLIASAIGCYILEVDYKYLDGLIHRINNLGNKINQIAHRINSVPDKKIYKYDLKLVHNELINVCELLRKNLLNH